MSNRNLLEKAFQLINALKTQRPMTAIQNIRFSARQNRGPTASSRRPSHSRWEDVEPAPPSNYRESVESSRATILSAAQAQSDSDNKNCAAQHIMCPEQDENIFDLSQSFAIFFRKCMHAGAPHACR